MEIRIDDNAGYCFGVVKAIGAAEEELSRDGSLYCLGDIVHNSAEVERLRSLGLEVIDHRRLPELTGKKVLIRAHGEPPATYRTADELGIRLIDATCPIVLALQQRIRKGYDEMQRVGDPLYADKKTYDESAGRIISPTTDAQNADGADSAVIEGVMG